MVMHYVIGYSIALALGFIFGLVGLLEKKLIWLESAISLTIFFVARGLDILPFAPGLLGYTFSIILWVICLMIGEMAWWFFAKSNPTPDSPQKTIDEETSPKAKRMSEAEFQEKLDRIDHMR